MAADMVSRLDSALGANVNGAAESPEQAPDMREEGELLMRDFIDAVKGDNVADAWEAFKALHEYCRTYSEEAPDYQEEV